MTHGRAWPDPRRLVLASTSPRRRALLREAGIEHDAIAPGVDDAELTPGAACGKRWVMSLAYLKARAGVDALRATGDARDCVVLGADTLCQLDDGTSRELMIAPRDASEARRMLRAMRSREHAVYTGLALVELAGSACADASRRHEPPRAVIVDCARVRWGHVEDDEIERYIESGGWRGKAGAYNLTERVAEGWPIEVEGDPQGVMGLPIRRLAELSRALGGPCCAA
ncbi:MAG: Maf family protein [Phycisphaerales bacterium]|jgi:septum formation protein|nr:Maf family protein [Phycisphaerales bacterium]